MEGRTNSWLQWHPQKSSEKPVEDGNSSSVHVHGGVTNIINFKPDLSNSIGNSRTKESGATSVGNIRSELLQLKEQWPSITEQLKTIRNQMAL